MHAALVHQLHCAVCVYVCVYVGGGEDGRRGMKKGERRTKGVG